MFEIEWKSSHYHSDGRRRSRPKASTLHGWLVKWRATFSGNETLRREGMREMREAKAIREYKRQRSAAKRAKRGLAKSGMLSCFGSGNAKKSQPHRPTNTMLTRGSQSSRSNRQVAIVRPPPTRGQRPQVSRRPTAQSSRRPSYSSRKDVGRLKVSKT